MIATTTVVGAAGLAILSVPFIESWLPSERARAAGAPVKVDISKLQPGQQIAVAWRGKPVWVLYRSENMLQTLQSDGLRRRLLDPDSSVATQQPAYARNALRSRRPDYFVVIGICTHLGCVPLFRPEVAAADLGPDWPGGYFCPCHGSRFDFAGRVFKNVPAPSNLVVPPYHYLSNTLIEVGVDGDQPGKS